MPNFRPRNMLNFSQEKNAAVIKALHNLCLPDKDWNLESVSSILSQAETFSIIVSDGNKKLGFSLFRLIGDEAEIISLGIVSEMREKGVGKKLLAETIAKISAACCKKIFLEVDEDNAAAIAIYKSGGFVKTGTRKNYYRRSNGEIVNAIIMVLQI